MAIVTVTYTNVEDAELAEGGRIARETFKSEKDAVAFSKEVVEPGLRKRRAKILQALATDAGVTREDFSALRISAEDPEHPQQALSLNALQSTATAIQSVNARFLGLGPIFTSNFYEHVHKNGASFSLGGRGKFVDADADLTQRQGPGPDGSWNDTISGVDTGKLVAITLLCEHTYFQGSKHVMFVDDNDLTNNGLNGGSWNDQASSVATGTVDLETLLRLIGASL